jgi:spore coat protein U-like protein
MFFKRNAQGFGALAAMSLISASSLITNTADAATDTANLSVTASVAANCTISTSTLAFGAYDPVVSHSASALEGTGTVSVTCTNGSAVTVALGEGANADAGSTADVPLRRLNDGGVNNLSYFLYSDVGRTTVWGGTTDSDVEHTGTGTSTDLTVYGRIPAGQNVPAAAYTDTVVATVTF